MIVGIFLLYIKKSNLYNILFYALKYILHQIVLSAADKNKARKSKENCCGGYNRE